MEFLNKLIVALMASFRNWFVPKNKILISVDDPIIQQEFMRIHDIPYDEKLYNCKNKASDFGNYLLDNGATNVFKVVIYHKDNSYTHEYVLWGNRAFDPTNQILSYGVDKDKYIVALQQIGFTGMILTSPYVKRE